MKRFCGRKHLQVPSFIEIVVMCTAEFSATALLIFFGCMGLTNYVKHDLVFDSVCFGMLMMLFIVIFGHISGGYFNPVITIWAAIYGTLPVKIAPLYIISQFIGALLGYATLMGLMSEEYFYDGVCVNKIEDEDVSVTQALFLELTTTMILIFVYCGVWDHRCLNRFDSSPLKIGFAYTVLMNATGSLTGCGMNPARSFAAAVCNNMWDHHWIYWLGPIIGSVVGTYTYMWIFAQPVLEEFTLDTRCFKYVHDATHHVGPAPTSNKLTFHGKLLHV